MKVTCYSCRWSIGTMDGLWCGKHERMAIALCNIYMRESGADEPE